MAYSKEFFDLVNALDGEVLQNLRQGLELGRWPDGKLLTKEQQKIVMETLLLADHGTAAKEADNKGAQKDDGEKGDEEGVNAKTGTPSVWSTKK